MSWRELAACRDVNPDVFFPASPHQVRQAKRYCADCPVRAECLAAGWDEPSFCADGSSHVYFVVRDDDLERFVFALVEQWGAA